MALFFSRGFRRGAPTGTRSHSKLASCRTMWYLFPVYRPWTTRRTRSLSAVSTDLWCDSEGL